MAYEEFIPRDPWQYTGPVKASNTLTLRSVPGPYLHVLNVSQVGILGGQQQPPGLVKLGLHLQRLVVEQRELGLQHSVLPRFPHHLLGKAPQGHLGPECPKAISKRIQDLATTSQARALPVLNRAHLETLIGPHSPLKFGL